METTFISIHDLTEDATILYSSDSVVDILGYTPEELVSRSVWDFFPPEEVPYAKNFHQSKVHADKAAVLAYCRVRGKQGDWIGCECCFTVVYDVIVVCTSIYQRGLKSDQRAIEAPLVRRIFSSSPKDPRYHMLSHISAKFSQPARQLDPQHEPRAALFVNRFTRTATIMHATQGLKDIVGIPADTMRGRSFYFCIHENCLPDAIRCLENAKANNSIAYLRFWFRDPRTHENTPVSCDDDGDEDMDLVDDDDYDAAGAEELPVKDDSSDRSHGSSNVVESSSSMDVDDGPQTASRNSSGDSTHPADTREAVFGSDAAESVSSSSSTQSPRPNRSLSPADPTEPIELEAVISCASDGLVMCLRRARPLIPPPTQRPTSTAPATGIFAAPWAMEPILPPMRSSKASVGFGPTLTPTLTSPTDNRDSPQSAAAAVNGPSQEDYMSAIRDQAIFAWALIGINGSLAQHGTGKPLGESVPSEGLPMWTDDCGNPDGSYQTDDGNLSGQDGSPNKAWSPLDTRPDARMFGDPGLKRKHSSGFGHSSGNSTVDTGSATPYSR